MEAFSDGVIAIIITIMVLKIKVPEHGHGLRSLIPLAPFFLSYIVSFAYVGIYWYNHHQINYLFSSVNGKVLWANLFLLFWLSLIPFGTEWMTADHFGQVPVAVYGFILLMCAISYRLFVLILTGYCGRQSELGQPLGKEWKARLSTVVYVIAIITALWLPLLACVLYAAVAFIWFMPDRGIEKKNLNNENNNTE